ncbi:MAG: hypothetical protein KC549_02355 [Myxococcales bacterium]|nr:hypothetical protein [Myxococcales bacterium]MCB9545262.1 hypothetical protein [Myxococcales bacterium]
MVRLSWGLGLLVAGVAVAQEDGLKLDDDLAPRPAAAPVTEAPAPELPVDKDLLRSDIRAAEGFLEEIERGRRKFDEARPLYRKYPVVAYLSEAAAGAFGAGVVGLVGGSIGEAIDAGDPADPLGGVSGRAFGVLGGAYAGSSMGVWGAARLFEKPVHPGWAFLGSGVGTIVGGGAATGLLFALEDDKQTAGTAAVATLFVFQVAGAMLFTELGIPDDPKPVAAEPEGEPALREDP